MTMTLKQRDIKLHFSLEHPICTRSKQKAKCQISLFPSEINPGVAILLKKNTDYENGRVLLASVLPATTRKIWVGNSDEYPRIQNQKIQEINCPSLLFFYSQYVLGLDAGKGYLFRYNKRKTIDKARGALQHYFFPHVYHEGYMCVRDAAFSPKSLHALFWGSNFYHEWYKLYEQHRIGSNRLNLARLPDGSSDYNKFQHSSGPVLDDYNRAFISNYNVWFETEAKPIGVFYSSDINITSLVADESKLKWKDYYGINPLEAVVGFAFNYGDDYMIHLRENKFLRVSKDLVSII